MEYEYALDMILAVISGVLIGKYYSFFLTPKVGKPFPTAVGFGMAYTVSHFTVYVLATPLTGSPFTVFKMIVLAGIIYVLSFIFFKKETGKQIFLLCSFLAVQDICNFINISTGMIQGRIEDLLTGIFINVDEIQSAEQVMFYLRLNMAFSFLLYGFIYGACGFFAIKGITGSFFYKNHPLRLTESLSLIFPCLSVLAITNTVRILLVGNNRMMLAEEIPGILISLTALLLLFTMIASVKLFQKAARLYLEEKNEAVLREQLRQLQNQDMGGIYTEIRGLRHDMKSHLANLRLLTQAAIGGQADAEKELGNYFGKMNETLDLLKYVYETGNSVSDAVIHQAYLTAKREGIRFSSDFIYPAGKRIDAYDIAVILSNALENAGEACLGLPAEERFIRLGCRAKGALFLIEVENSYAGEVVFGGSSDLPVSSKSDVDRHGLGIFNIKRVAQKYRGEIDIALEEKGGRKVFRLTVMLQESMKDIQK